MNEKTINMESFTYFFLIGKDKWELELAKSQTRVKDIRQLAIIKEEMDLFVPSAVKEGDDLFTFSYAVNKGERTWEEIRNLSRSDKLRLLCNLSRFQRILRTRMTFFLHPNNVVFDDNLIPFLIHRGIRDLVPPYTVDEEKFLLQYKCMVVGLFSKKYTFDELYSGSLTNAKDTEFERQVGEVEDFDALVKLLKENYMKEKAITDKNMQLVAKKRFRLFKRMSFTMMAVVIILAIPLTYFGVMEVPFQEQLLEAHKDFLSMDYGNVINDLENQKPESLPDASKYVLAYSYVKSEKLGDDEKSVVLNNISLKSDPNYLLYWIYNGRGNFDKSIDLAKYIDDPSLIIYGLLQKIDTVKNDPKLSGTDREKKVQQYQDQYQKYVDKYNLHSTLEPQTTTTTTDGNQGVNEDTKSDSTGKKK